MEDAFGNPNLPSKRIIREDYAHEAYNNAVSRSLPILSKAPIAGVKLHLAPP